MTEHLTDLLRALQDIRPEPEPFEVWREACGLAAAAADEIERLCDLDEEAALWEERARHLGWREKTA